ncbi:DUF4369 domain-containing protein [Thalassobellus suaedae]|uniref:DUF4369 domain-containing protein n=1 Tax=Thalassobellus suaedae TaxID=3074124 RepID=A0ABY9XUJ9_9FLAO|nr:DUF4369 domain-containing protein [Flavobacteriaceae bacterium HL-DH14]
MKNALLLFIAFMIIACGEKQHDLTVKGQIKGLKKGTIYLKKANDSALISIDSLTINGDSEFELHSNLKSPEVLFLYLDKNSSEKDRIRFFADKGITEINTSLKNFAFDAEINGSTQQKTLEEYEKMMSRFKDQNLNLIKEKFEALKANNKSKLDSLENIQNSMQKRQYLFTVNFALNHKDSEVAPYLALTEIYNAKINLLDTINKSLSVKVKNSKYGKELQEFIDKINESEK